MIMRWAKVGRRTVTVLPLFLLLTGAGLSGCGPNEARPDPTPQNDVVREGDLVRGTGTVRWFEVEGGFYAIEGDDHTTYDPLSLPKEFQKDQLRVYFEARIREDLMGTHMVGPLVELLTIRER